MLALVSWLDASLSEMISLRDSFLEFKPTNLKDSCILTNVFLFFPLETLSVYYFGDLMKVKSGSTPNPEK